MCECEGPHDFQSDCQRGLWGGKDQLDLKELTRKLENWVKIVHLKFWREKVQLLLYIPRLGTTVLLKPVNKDDIYGCISQGKRAIQALAIKDIMNYSLVHWGPMAAQPWLPAPWHRGRRPYHDQWRRRLHLHQQGAAQQQWLEVPFFLPNALEDWI